MKNEIPFEKFRTAAIAALATGKDHVVYYTPNGFFHVKEADDVTTEELGSAIAAFSGEGIKKFPKKWMCNCGEFPIEEYGESCPSCQVETSSL